MSNLKFLAACNSILNEYKAENYILLFRHDANFGKFFILYNKEKKKIVRAIINDLIEFAVFSENGKIKIEIDNENKMYQY